MATVDSIKASTFKLSRRRPAASPVHDIALKIVTDTSIDGSFDFSFVIKLELNDSSTFVLLKGQVTTNSAFANVRNKEVADELGDLVGLRDGIGVGARVMG
jgi:hypothetical protein